MSATEKIIGLGETINPESMHQNNQNNGFYLRVHLDTGWLLIPFGIYIQPFQIEGIPFKQLSTILACSRTPLQQIALSNNPQDSQHIEALKNLSLSVKLPLTEPVLTSYPCPEQLSARNRLVCVLFDAINTVPVFPSCNPGPKEIEAISQSLPAIVRPAAMHRLTPPQWNKGLLAIPADPLYQRQIQMSFNLERPVNLPKEEGKIGSEYISWAERLLSVLLRQESSILRSCHNQWTAEMAGNQVTPQDIHFVRSQLQKNNLPADTNTVIETIKLFKSTALAAIAAELAKRAPQ